MSYKCFDYFSRNCEDLFAEGRQNAGVLFASIPNFTEFYSEENHALEIRLHYFLC